MTKEQEVLQQFLTKREEVVRSIEQLRLQLQQQTELLLRIEGAIEGLGLIGIEITPAEGPAAAETPE
jgi:hypothetical protein